MTYPTYKTSIIKGLLTACTVLTACAAVYAVPARRTPITFTQPDGQTITVSLRGDENSHYYLSEDGYLLLNVDGAMVYGDIDASGAIKASGIRASAADKRSDTERAFLSTINVARVYSALDRISEQRRGARSLVPAAQAASVQSRASSHPALVPGTYFPTLGAQKALVILVEYEDVKFNLDDPHDYFSRMLTEEGFSDYGGTGCAAEYFRDNAGDKFSLDIDLVGPVSLPQPRSYYGKNDMWGSDDKAHLMAVDACDILDDTVDFSQYDRDGDGKIDNVFIFYAGTGEASGGPADSVWPHSWQVTAGTSKKYYYDGVLLDHYACTNEWYMDRPDGIGTFVHEFSHVMGLPDLYATTTTTVFSPDAYDVMDYGPYNNDGRTPPYYSIYERYAFGWLEPEVLDSPADITLHDITSNEGYIVETKNPNEYFLFENRQKKGWDKYIPGHGMLIWHIDYNRSTWYGNTVNDNPSHQGVDLIEADNKRTNNTRSSDVFPGPGNVTAFTDKTTPAFVTWDNESPDMPITDIAEDKGVITFKVRGGVVDIKPVALQLVGTPTAGTLDLSWSRADNATCYLVSVYSDYLNLVTVDGWDKRNVGDVDHITVDGLQPETTYACFVKASNGYTHSGMSNLLSVTTGLPTLDFKTPVALDATSVDGDSFIAHWEAMPDASSYSLTVYTKGEPIIYSDTNSFKNGLAMPEGWQTNATQTFYNKAYAGAAIPSLRLGEDKAYIMTPDYDQDLTALSFWARGSSAAHGNIVRVLAKVNGSYSTIAEYLIDNDPANPITDALTIRNWEGETKVIDYLPAGTRSIRIEYCETVEHKGSVGIDDVTVEWGREYPLIPVEGYDNISVGSALSYEVTGLMPTTEYFYTVTATDGTLTSKVSNEVTVTTSESTGITDIEIAASVTAIGSDIYVCGTPGVSVTMHDMLGRLVASAIIGPDGTATLHRPDGGVYIVRAAGSVAKIR